MNSVIDPDYVLFEGVDPQNFYIILSDYICFGGFLKTSFGLSMYLSFIVMWGALFKYGSFGHFRDFGYSFLWGVFVFSRRRMDFTLRHRDDALY